MKSGEKKSVALFVLSFPFVSYSNFQVLSLTTRGWWVAGGWAIDSHVGLVGTIWNQLSSSPMQRSSWQKVYVLLVGTTVPYVTVVSEEHLHHSY
jgi:hypothetical protein